jgi:hypothetical protein
MDVTGQIVCGGFLRTSPRAISIGVSPFIDWPTAMMDRPVQIGGRDIFQLDPGGDVIVRYEHPNRHHFMIEEPLREWMVGRIAALERRRYSDLY